MNREIKVSVINLCYNHEKYIRKTLEGFVKQKTNFCFEVLAHDDASTDGTANIIREFAEKYPDIIIPILQTDNQHSKKVHIRNTLLYPIMRGKYIAVCEGDDYWEDEYKLQKQVDMLEKYSDCVICTHDVQKVTEGGEVIVGDLIPATGNSYSEGMLEQDRFMREILQNGYPFHTSSFMYRKSLLDRYMDEKPEFYKLFPIGDFALLCYAATCGGCYYIHEVMSSYRTNAVGSWTTRIKTDMQKLSERYKKGIMALESLDQFTEYKYHEDICNVIIRDEITIYIIDRTYRKMLKYIGHNSLKHRRVKYLLLAIVDYILPDIFVKKK
ncbi:MAG: glycosyltransferase [Lachnospiraceae bacterium]|nr:glycosyltransferase [Lachnospiraceae bacterium]